MLPAQRGVDAVRSDDQVARDAHLPRRRGEAGDAVADADEPVPGAYRVGPQPFPHHVEQFHLEPAAVHG